MRFTHSSATRQQLRFLQRQFLQDGDLPFTIVLTDRLFCTWTDLLQLKQRGVDSVTQLHVNRRADVRKGIRLGKGDQIIRWRKPSSIRSVDR